MSWLMPLLPYLPSIIDAIGRLFKANPPSPTAPQVMLDCHDGICKTIDSLQSQVSQYVDHAKAAQNE